MVAGLTPQISTLQLYWINDEQGMVGFTVCYSDGTIENHMRPCTKETLNTISQELIHLRERLLHHDEEKIPTTGGNQ